jgi:acetyl-CoA carboxylase biotin carboxylase subunit
MTARVKVLVANRGEVAARVIRACRELGIPSVAICSDPDRVAPHVRMADSVVSIGGSLPAESYLDSGKVLAAARSVGATMIHPGYGFLSEDPAFREACDAAGVRFVGPTADQMRRLSHKLPARAAMAAAGVPVVPGSDGEVPDAEQARRVADRVGWPVMLKASAGGGGKGMRRVEGPDGMPAAFEASRREALAAFGSPSLFVEACVPSPRHVEVQFLADGRGDVVHLGERVCSVQRRHQKVIEEAPDPGLDPLLRQAMYQATLRAVTSLGYEGAGTVEYLVDPAGAFHFLEMNTRLQVEHAVTEAVLGVDLVQAQIRIALGEPLPWRQEDLVPRGAAIECRVCAEDPYNGFVASPGRLFRYRPPLGPFVRVDDGVEEGGEVCSYYDTLLAKVTVWGRTRPEAISRMERALGEFEIGGVRHNLPFLRHVLASREFRAGTYDTGLVVRIGPLPAADVVSVEDVAAAVAARSLMDSAPAGTTIAPSSPGPSAWRRATGSAPSWRRG